MINCKTKSIDSFPCCTMQPTVTKQEYYNIGNAIFKDGELVGQIIGGDSEKTEIDVISGDVMTNGKILYLDNSLINFQNG